jgi:hypothetical protein
MRRGIFLLDKEIKIISNTGTDTDKITIIAPRFIPIESFILSIVGAFIPAIFFMYSYEAGKMGIYGMITCSLLFPLFLYNLIALLINKPVIKINRNELSVSYIPLPWPGKKINRFDTKQINVVKCTYSKGKFSIYEAYELIARLNNGKDKVILKGLDRELDKPQDAPAIKDIIENMFNLTPTETVVHQHKSMCVVADDEHYTMLLNRNKLFGYGTLSCIGIAVLSIILINKGVDAATCPLVLMILGGLTTFILWAFNGIFLLTQYGDKIFKKN